MTLFIWVLVYMLDALLFLWLIFWGGAERIERRVIAGVLLNVFAITWTAEQIQLYAYIMLCASTFWFLLGLFIPELRFA